MDFDIIVNAKDETGTSIIYKGKSPMNIVFNAVGSWRANPGFNEWPADGAPQTDPKGREIQKICIHKEYNAFCLLVRLKHNSTEFWRPFVHREDRYEATLVVKQGDEVQLVMNDAPNGYGDNSGQMRVSVELKPT